MNSSPWTTTAQANALFEIPSGNYPPDFCSSDSYSWIVFPGTVTTLKFPEGQLPRGLLPSSIFPWIISPWITTPRQLTLPWNSPRNKWQLNFALENDVSIINRCRSAKVRFAHFGLEILNKFWKINRQGAVHATSQRYFTLRKWLL